MILVQVKLLRETGEGLAAMLLNMQVFWDVKLLSKWLSTFRKNVVLSSSRVKRSKAGKKCGNTYLHIGTCWWIFGKGFALTDYSD
jgi:hypothetical protein